MPHNQGYQCFQTVQILSRLHLASLHPRTKYYLRAQTVTDVIVSQNDGQVLMLGMYMSKISSFQWSVYNLRRSLRPTELLIAKYWRDAEKQSFNADFST